jgi:Na+/H+ antiporter NhaD/arsenite permease-like protein
MLAGQPARRPAPHHPEKSRGLISPATQDLRSDAHTAIAYAIFLSSYFVFAVGRLPRTKIDRPAMAFIGAVLMFVFKVLTPQAAIASIDYATMILLFSMMLIVASLHMDGFFEWISRLVIDHLDPAHLLPGIIFTSGILSAFLVNDVVCLFMAPLVLRVCRQMSRPALPYLLALATASNIGSTATITGNPQNILIGSLSRIPYLDFMLHLGPVALIGLFIDWGVLRWIYRRALSAETEAQSVAGNGEIAPVNRPRLLWAMGVLLVVLIAFLLGYPPPLAAAGGGLLLLIGSENPRRVYEEVDWSLLVFFVGLFLITGAAEQAGIGEKLLITAQRWNLHRLGIFAVVVTLLSNLVSNVPAVMLLKNTVSQFPDPRGAWLALAMVSTLAGNLTITGSVANIIVVEKARADVHISFREYLRLGIPVTLATVGTGLIWLNFLRN